MNVRGGQLIQSNGNPVLPGTKFSGPLLAGSVLRTGGTRVAGLGATPQDALANVGYAKMTQVGRITEATSFASPDLVIPAQSLITSLLLLPIVAFTAATVNAGSATTPALFGALTPGTPLTIATETGATLLNWLNTGTVDIQLVFAAAAAGPGVGVVIMDYIQGINAATS